MPDQDPGRDDYRLKRRSEPVPPETPAAPAPGSRTRPVLLGAVAAVTALAAALVVTHLAGKGGHGPPDAGRRPSPAGTTTTASAPRVLPITAGPGCGGNGYRRVGYYVDGRAGWLSGSGGYAGAGCDGRFDALPMSGDASRADPTLYAQWTFDPGPGRRCTVALYIPADDRTVYVGGSPAHYTVLRSTDGRALLSFTVDQPRSRGRWASSAAFTVDGPFSVRLANTGKDWTDTKSTFTHIAAAQARATCG